MFFVDAAFHLNNCNKYDLLFQNMFYKSFAQGAFPFLVRLAWLALKRYLRTHKTGMLSYLKSEQLYICLLSMHRALCATSNGDYSLCMEMQWRLLNSLHLSSVSKQLTFFATPFESFWSHVNEHLRRNECYTRVLHGSCIWLNKMSYI